MPTSNSTIDTADPMPPPTDANFPRIPTHTRLAETATAARWDGLNPTDADLIDAWVTDNCLEALDTLVRRYSQMVLSVCIRRCHDRSDADDAMQTTFLYLAQSAKKIRDPNRLAGWLHRVAQRASIATMMSPERTQEDLSDVPSTPVDPLERLTLRHQAIVLDEELSELPDKYRSAIVLHLQQGVTVSETARQMGTTEGTVRGWLVRGKRRLARQLRLRGVAPMAAWAAAHAWSVSETMAAQAAFELTCSSDVGSTADPDASPGASPGNSHWANAAKTSNFSALESHLSKGIATMPVVTILGSTAAVGLAVLATFAVPAGDNAIGRNASVLTFATPEEDGPSVPARISQESAATKETAPLATLPPQTGNANAASATTPSIPNAPALPVPPTPPEVPTTNTAVADRVMQTLDQPTTLAFESDLRSLPDALQLATGLPVLLDEQAMTLAQIDLDSLHVQFSSKGEQPLRTLLRKALEREGLKATVDDDGLLITADMTVLTRRGISTDRWLDMTPEEEKKYDEIMDKKVSYQFIDLPLHDAVRVMSEDLNFPIMIDNLELQDDGLSEEVSVDLNVNSVSFRSALRLLLRDLNLTYQFKDEVLQITTHVALENSLRSRLYFLEGTGLPRGGNVGTIEMITTSIQPEIWEQLGGVSTISSVNHSQEGRPALLISTTDDVHNEIKGLMQALRETHTGSDPRLTDEEMEQQRKELPPPIGGVGGMF